MITSARSASSTLSQSAAGSALRKAAAQGPSIAHRAIRDTPRRTREPAAARIGHRTVLDLGVGERGAVDNRVAFVGVAAQIRTGAYVDE